MHTGCPMEPVSLLAGAGAQHWEDGGLCGTGWGCPLGGRVQQGQLAACQQFLTSSLTPSLPAAGGHRPTAWI